MENFEIINPVRVVFGKEQWSRLPELLKAQNAKKIMVAYGGGSVKKIGLFDTVMDAIKDDFEIVEFGGIPANPEYTKLMEAVELARKESIDFIIALGGGSVIDGVKFISGAIGYKGEPWDVLERKEGCVFDTAVPFGTILTIPATGSEVNSGGVISRSEIGAKRTMGGPLFFPVFSFCDPTVVATLPKRQLANGIIDAYMHVLEQYVTVTGDNLLQERQAEAILSTLIEVKGVVDNPSDYDLAANFMLCASHALNGNLRCGVKTDWTTHMIGHELTAKYGIDHARTLAIVGPRLFENQFERKKNKLAQYGERVWGLKGEAGEVALEAIKKTEEFFQELGVSTKLSEYSEETAEFPQYVSAIFEERDWTALGEHQAINPKDVKDILEACI
ncbi:iron-containing alcohol dehydrogenase [Crocinitomicaceae bacterium]|nr:iron-containing alcohol dehydrogenase [Crocinitomicaceae bacterium]MDC0257481.1 iron-containing alcohol dehydrogenase [Crocinitomicaceae bacterium]